MEAFAAGCAVVSTRVSGIEDYENEPLARGVLQLFDIGDIDGAAAKIQNVARLPQDERRRRARAFAEAEFSIEVCMTRYEPVVERASHDFACATRGASTPSFGAYVAALAVAKARLFKLHLWQRTVL